MRYPFLLALVVLACSPAASAQSVIEVAPFRSIALRDGGDVTVRHGDVQRVTLIAGQAEIATEGTQLHISRSHDAPRRERLRVEIVTPVLDAVAVSNGGRLVLAGAFPGQPQLAASVSNGGGLDVRSLAADDVTASVNQGGFVLTRPASRLTASVSHGGAITYWGRPAVTRAVTRGGIIGPGRPEDEGRPLDELTPVVEHAPRAAHRKR